MGWFIVGFVAGSLSTVGTLAGGWFAHKRLVHTPKMREMLARLAELERLEREREDAEQRARDTEGQ